ncbi:MAG TPA: hypothetical protein DIW47_10195 [Bacteroidetes bacterium]|nr:hypothetical protein [Bacteroidota bacterium]
MKNIRLILTVLTVYITVNFSAAQTPNPQPHLHVNTRWKECSFQIDPSLTQDAWHQFTKEAGMVLYYRPLTDAKPMGAGRFEFSILQWTTWIDEREEAWNNTFVHPDSQHWLIGGEKLPFPGISVRAGITPKIDAGLYWTVRPGANYGVAGAQVQYNFLNDTIRNWSASTRFTFSTLYGPADLNLNVSGVDFLASKKIAIFSNWASVSPYAGFSATLSHAHEKTAAVDLKDENILGFQAMAGAAVQIYMVRLSAEYNFANVNTLSYKLGVNFKF